MMKAARLLALMLLVGCKDATAPLTGDVYVLKFIAGASVPAFYAGGIGFRILADTVGLDAGGRGQRRTVYEWYQGTRRYEHTWFNYTVVDSRIEMAFDCVEEPCFTPPQFAGTLTTTQLTISESKPTLVPLVYHRVTLPVGY